MDSAVVYDLSIRSPVSLSKSWFYDWFIIEFTKPIYANQPYTITCRQGAVVPCFVT